MKRFCSHTLVKNGMPFIEPCLRQVIPYAERCLITVSDKSCDGTLGVLRKLKDEFPDKIFVEFEHTKQPGELTKERQKQVMATTEDWILFLDDDDFWPSKSIEDMISMPDEDVDGYSISPYQITDKDHYDTSWNKKYFLKWFKNQPGINYRHPWPRDMIYLNDQILYWKYNNRVPIIDKQFIHLSYLKYHSFRTEKWAKQFEFKKGENMELPIEIKQKLKRLYDYI